ncbi:MAG: HAMP domain-containing sensor histidine kinase, partial [Alphaproteobacteria bacterium]|nr:HAMP domain-containing sensor histidine kinase [Alphaproteobacteria bacterium]
TGIVVFNARREIVMANQSARDLAAPNRMDPGAPVPAQIMNLYKQDMQEPHPARGSIRLGDQGHQVLVRFAELNSDQGNLTLAFLEDQRQIAKEAQQLKLASLGRMSATIAHEIRNPLSAINHAAGLLADTASEEGDKRLLEIIFSHVSRVNNIIDDVLNLSRRPSGAAERFNLLEALREIVGRWQERGTNVSMDNIRRDIDVRFDRRQFEQVIDNLVANARLHAGEDCQIRISADKEPSRGLPRLRFSDNGPGIPDDVQPHLFEPFFTTSHQGTGLGLFLCREMCETNQAWLDHDPDSPGASFVITFAHPDRVFK